MGLVSSRPLAHPEPYLQHSSLRLHLNAFRGEPAISGFVWHFTSTHSSSQVFATTTSFGPSLRDYRSFTLAIGSSPGFGSNPRDSIALLRLAFASAPFVHEVNLAAEINSSAHSSISTPSSLLTERLRPYVGPRFQIYFTPLPGFFSPFPHGTGTLSVAKGI